MLITAVFFFVFEMECKTSPKDWCGVLKVDIANELGMFSA